MANPGFYSPDKGKVEVRETHVSHVFLAGDGAYKLKKPLQLPFLDASTAERRHQLCREELRLNRRLAPDVYVGVRAVVRSDDGFKLADEDHPDAFDYAVEMRRYDEHDTLASRLADGRVRTPDITVIARTLADFHASAPPVITSPSAHDLECRLAQNIHELFTIAEQRPERWRILELMRFTHAFLAAHASTLAERASAGFIREGHGDLRAEHVLLGSKLQIVDCIEFDRHLREIDTADDLAFLVMDLTAAGGHNFASSLVRAYRRAGGDPGADWLVAFYSAHHALTRAKVALLRAGQFPANHPQRVHQGVVARDLIALAEMFAWRARLPLVIAVCGLPATGKSSLARTIAKASGLSHLNSDVTRKRLAGIPPDARGPKWLYSAETNERTYEELGRLAAAESALNSGAVVDATFRHRADRFAFARRFDEAAPVMFVECCTPASVMARRAAGRDRTTHRESDADTRVTVEEMHSWEPLDEISAASHLILRSDLPIEMQLTEVQALIDGRLIELRAHDSTADDGGA